MIKILTVEATDCFAYTHLVFNFAEGIHSIEGVNGSAKTSLFMCLMQGFFNRNAKGTKIDEVNNNITGMPYEIRIHFQKGTTDYLVVNSRKNGAIEIYKNGKPKHVKRIPDNLKIIEDILGVDYAMFRDLVYQSPRSSINLLETDSDNARKGFLNRILLLDELDDGLEKFKAREKELSGKNGSLEVLRNQLRKFEDSIVEDYSEEQGEIDTTKQEGDLATLRKGYEDLQIESAKINAQMQPLYKDKSAYEASKDTHDQAEALERKIQGTKVPANTIEELHNLRDRILKDKQDTLQDIKEYQEKAKALQYNSLIEAQKLELLSQMSLIDLPSETLEDLQSTLKKIDKDSAVLSTLIETASKDLTLLVKYSIMGSCPTCRQSINKGLFAGKIADLEETVKKYQADHASISSLYATTASGIARWTTYYSLKSQVEKLEGSQKACDKTQQEVEESLRFLEVRLQVLSEDITNVSEQIDIHGDYQKDLLALAKLKAVPSAHIDYTAVVKKIDELSAAMNRCSAALKETTASIEAASAMLKKCQEFNTVERTIKAVNAQKRAYNEATKLKVASMRIELAQLEEQHDLIKQWQAVLGPKGFRLHKMQTFLGLLNASMKKYSDMLSDGKIRCTFFIEAGEIEFIVTDANKTIAWSCWSEGEKARVKMACLFAVLELLEVMGSVSFNVLALDEIFSALDLAGKEGLFRVLHYLKNKGRAIYTIAHTKLALDTEYDSVVRAHKEEDGTTTITQ